METAIDRDAALVTAEGSERSAGVQSLLSQFRPRIADRMSGSERRAELAVALGFLGVAAPLALLAPGHGDHAAWALALLLVVFTLTATIEFDVGTGYGVPTQLVLIPVLFTLPPGWVPLFVAAANILGRLPAIVRGARHPDRMIMAVADAWYTIGPAVVFELAGPHGGRWSDGAVVLVAIAAQFACDLMGTAAREWLRLREAPRLQVRLMGMVWLVDLCLSPIGLAIAVTANGHPAAATLSLPLSGLLMYFARDRRARMATAMELSGAYRGTAMLLGDVVEADDAYTGSHSRDVVELSMGVGPFLGLDADQMRKLEFAALLHDVGKIAIPKEIINKPGKLDADERRLIETHTIEGETMLKSVGGLLGQVGTIVRSCHERYDGKGYPDGLVGESIPVEARIVACCDAFNAMTTDRSYRKALPLAQALDELRNNRGTQFDPRVVDALLIMHAEVEAELAVSAAAEPVALPR